LKEPMLVLVNVVELMMIILSLATMS